MSTFRVGSKLGTTIYRDNETQPCAIVVNDGDRHALARRIKELLNADSQAEAQDDGVCANLTAANKRLEVLQSDALNYQAMIARQDEALAARTVDVLRLDAEKSQLMAMLLEKMEKPNA